MSMLLPPARSQLTPFPRLPTLFRSTLRPALHLPQLRAAIANPANSASGSGPRIVIMGDSTSTQTGNDALAPSENLYGVLTRRFMEDNLGVAFTFHDRGIGGSTWNDLQGIPDFAGGVLTPPAWYTVTSQPWITTYVGNLDPDCVIIASGTNDHAFCSPGQIRQVLAHFNNATAFPVKPDLVFVTNKGRTPTDTEYAQNGRLQAASLVRSVAQAGPGSLGHPQLRLGLIDLGRFETMARRGFDPCAQYLVRTLADVVVPNPSGAYYLPPCDGDFDLLLSFPGQAAQLAAAGNLRLYVGSGLDATQAQARGVLLLTPNAGNYLTSYTISTHVQNGASWPIGSGDVTFRVTAKQSRLTLAINGAVVFDRLVARCLGRFTPSLSFSGSAAALTMQVSRYSAGVMVRYAPPITDAQVWGADTPTTGGNGINHAGSRGIAEIEQAVLEATDFHCL
jgi:hypothetical protein